jgi:two-component system chemotaxis sensor kinase CheA
MRLNDDESWLAYAMDAQDALGDIEGSLLSLEANPCHADEINRLYRALHTLKGNSALLGLTAIESVAHAAEDMIGLARDAGVALDAEPIELMLALGDRLKVIVERAGRERRDAEPSEVEELVERVRSWTLAHGGTARARDDAPDAGFEIWSEPPGPAQPAAEPESAEFFLALCRELVPRVLALLERAARGDQAALRELPPLLSELSRPALRLGRFELVDCLGTLAQTLEAGHAAELEGQRAELVRLLIALEQDERARAPAGSDFGIARLCAQAGTAPSTAQPSARPPAPLRAPTRSVADRPSAPSPPTARQNVAPAGSAERGSTGEYLRIDARKLSLVMELAGELALACGAVTHHPELEGKDIEGFSAASHKLEMLIRELQNEVSAMRLVPVAGVFQRMRRVVRDAARRTGKSVELRMAGEETEIDKVMVDSLHDPLVHMVRNAIDHGIEPTEERVALGKRPVGTIVLEASHQGGEVSVKVRDDGRGLSRERIVQRARERGLLASGVELSDAQVAELVFLPGFSTKDKIDELSGRGVGMDVIKTTIEGLRGRVHLETQAGRGTSLNITVPLTLAFVEAMVVRERERLFALPIEKVFEVFKVESGQLSRNSADGTTTIRLRDSLIPLLWLHRFYGEADGPEQRLEGKLVVVVQNSRGSVALPVDALLGNQPVMLKPLSGVLAGVRAAAGCGMLRSGDVAIALDCERLHA